MNKNEAKTIQSLLKRITTPHPSPALKLFSKQVICYHHKTANVRNACKNISLQTYRHHP